MKFSEEQVKEIVALREDLMRQVDKHQEGIEMLEKNIVVLDGFLKDSSFVKASKLDTKIEPKEEIKIPNPVEKSKPVENSIPIKRGNDGKIIANAYVTPEQVSIILDEQILINADTPPFKSFFLDRIIGEMKKKDLPTKFCSTCKRSFTWRKKWKLNWSSVKYCSKKCSGNKIN